MGLAGVTEAQKRALVVTEKKMKRREALAKAAMRHAVEQQPMKTVYYKTENPVYQAG
jgi:pre-60S factor REI1